MPDPIRIRSGWGGNHWPEAGRMILAHRFASGPDPFGQNLTQSARTKPDPGWFCIILSGSSVEERNRVWKRETGSGPVASCQKPGQMIPAHQLASRSDAFGQTITRPSRSDPGRYCTIWSMLSLEKRSWNGCGKLDPAYTIRPRSGCTLAVTKTFPDRIRHVYWEGSTAISPPKLQTQIYDIVPPTTAMADYAIGLQKLSVNEQFFDDAQTAVRL